MLFASKIRCLAFALSLSASADAIGVEGILEHLTRSVQEGGRLEIVKLGSESVEGLLAPKILESYHHFAKALRIIDTKSASALQHLFEARKHAPRELLVFIGYYEGLARAQGGDYRAATDFYRKVYQHKIWDDVWRDKILGQLFASLFYLDRYDDFSILFEQNKRRITRSPALNDVLFLAAQVFEKKKRYDVMFRALEEVAALYPLTSNARHAFTKLIDYSCEDKKEAGAPTYYFSQYLLKHIVRNVAVDNGIRDLILAGLHDKVRLPGKPPTFLDELTQVEFLVEARLFDDALALAKAIESKHEFHQDHEKRQKLLLLMGRSANRINRHQDAARYFSIFSKAENKNSKRLKGNEFLADSLSYGGFRQSAAELYGTLAKKTNNSLLRWHHFWSQYRSEKLTDALGLLRRSSRSHYVPARDPAYPHGTLYWQARLLEKQNAYDEAKKLYANVLNRAADDIYANIIASRHPALSKLITEPHPGASSSDDLSKLKPAPPSNEEFTEQLKLLYGVLPYKEVANLIVGFTLFGQKDLAAMLLNQLDRQSLRRDAINALSYIAYKNDAFYLLRDVAERALQKVAPVPNSWHGILAHQEKFSHVWQDYYPIAFEETVKDLTSRLEIDPFLVLSVIRAESNYRSDALSYAGARGLMQIMPYTAIQIAERLGDRDFRLEKLWQPQVNIVYGSWYLKKLLVNYRNHPVLAIAAYNAGPHAVNSWLERCHNCGLDEFIESISYQETRRYVKEVLKHYTRYSRLYKKIDFLPEIFANFPNTSLQNADLF